MNAGASGTPEGPSQRNRWLLIAIVAIVALIAAIVIVVLVTNDDSSDDDAANTTVAGSTTTTVAATTTVAGPTPDQVTKAQEALAAVGCYAGPIDGIYGPQTDAAIRAFQEAKGLTVDGIVGPQTIAALEEAQAAGETVCGGDGGSGEQTTTTPAAADVPVVELVTSDGVNQTFDVVTCTSTDATSFELTAQTETAQLTASASAGTGPIVLTEGNGHREGTIKEAQVEASGDLTASGSLTAADDSASASTFELIGTCTTP